MHLANVTVRLSSPLLSQEFYCRTRWSAWPGIYPMLGVDYVSVQAFFYTGRKWSSITCIDSRCIHGDEVQLQPLSFTAITHIQKLRRTITVCSQVEELQIMPLSWKRHPSPNWDVQLLIQTSCSLTLSSTCNLCQTTKR